MWPRNATEVGGKETKTSKFRDIETSIQSNMRNKHDKFHNVYTNVYTQNWFKLVHKLSRSHITTTGMNRQIFHFILL